MTLRFENLAIRNFGPFRSVDGLNLATEAESPIVVIHGENTLGKTNLFRALRWCLYGSPVGGEEASKGASALESYMNRPAFGEGEREMEVRIDFDADGKKYHLTRTATFGDEGVPRVVADLRIGPTAVPMASIETEIGRLLHPQISEFFLFDGELLRDFYDRLNSEHERDLLRRSIDSVLGIPALQRAARDISILQEDVQHRQIRQLKNREEAERAQRRLREIKSRQESSEKDREEMVSALSRAKLKLEDVKERIASVDNLKADAREMETLESQLNEGDSTMRALGEEMQSLLKRGWLSPVSTRLTAALREIQTKNDTARENEERLRKAREDVDLLREQMRGGTCPTCHQELPPPDAGTRQNLDVAEAALRDLLSMSVQPLDVDLERRIQALIDRQTVDRYRDMDRRMNHLESTQYERRRRLSSIKDRMKDNDAASIRRLGSDQEGLERAIERYEKDLKRLEEKQADLASEQNRLASSLRRLGAGDPGVAAEAYFFQYVSDLVARTIEMYQERTRSEVEAMATDMFMKLIRDPEGYSGITIGRDYRLDLVGKRGPSMKTSEGGRQLIALALIGALKRAAVRGGPVVLDSPLARLDLEHRENVLNSWIPELGSQAILLVQSGELTEAQASAIMGSRIGQSYRIYRPSSDPEVASIERTE